MDEAQLRAGVAATPDTRRETRRVVVAGMLGTMIEYFDFLVYATVSGLVFGRLFFPSDDEFVGTMLAISTFAVGFLVRPLGGIVFGHFGDRIGRRRVLFITLMMMGVATVLIGLLPTYDTIGVAAPILLVLLRVVQGLGVGGEYGGATVMVLEHANDSGRRGLFGGLTTASSSAGFLLASAVLALLTGVLTPEQFAAWGWRIPFLLSAVLLLVGLYVRSRIEESPIMQEAVAREETVQAPLLEVFRRFPRQVAIALLAPIGIFVAYYIVLVFSVPYATRVSGSPDSFMLTMLTVSQLIYLVAIVFWAWLSDRVGRRVPMLVGAACLLGWGFAFFPLLLSGSSLGVFVAFAGSMLFMSAIYGPLATFLAEMFGAGVRFTGMSFGYQIGSALAGGLSPVLATALVGTNGSWVPVAAMISVGALVTLVAVGISKDTSRVDLRD